MHFLQNFSVPFRRVAQQLDATILRACMMMDRQIVQLTRLVDNLLDMSRIDHDRMDVRKELVDVGAVIKAAVETNRADIEARRHELTLDLARGPFNVEGDPARLEQVFSNLLNNAAKYTEEGGHIGLTAERLGPDVVLRVCDTGIGMTAEMLTQAFDLFAQADRSLDRSQGGLGIGLSLVRGLVELHGGHPLPGDRSRWFIPLMQALG